MEQASLDELKALLKTLPPEDLAKVIDEEILTKRKQSTPKKSSNPFERLLDMGIAKLQKSKEKKKAEKEAKKADKETNNEVKAEEKPLDNTEKADTMTSDTKTEEKPPQTDSNNPFKNA